MARKKCSKRVLAFLMAMCLVLTGSGIASLSSKAADPTPESLGYTRVTLSEDFGVADGTYSANALTVQPYSGSLNNTYLDVDVAFGHDSNGNVDAYTGLRYANTGADWGGIRVSLGDGDVLRISDATSNMQDFTISAATAGVANFTSKFNLKLGVIIAASETEGLSNVTMYVWVNDKLVAQGENFTDISGIGNYAGLLVWNGASTTISTPIAVSTDTTPEELGYTRKTLSEDFELADGTYNTQGLIVKSHSGSLNNTYLDVDVTFGLDSNGGVDPYAGLRYAHSGGTDWGGLRISLGDNGVLRVSDATSNMQDFTITAGEAGVTNFTTKFNLKFAVKIAAGASEGLSDVTMSVWVNDKLVAHNKSFTGIQNIGNGAGILVWGGASTTIGTPIVVTEETTPEEMGYTRKTLSEDFGIADGLYDAQGLTEKAASGSLNNTYLDVDVAFGLDTNGGVDPYAGLRYASTGGWAGIRISLGDGGTLRISDATSNAQDFTITATEAGVTNFTTKFNLKLAVKIAANGAAGLSDVTMNVWVNDKLVAKDKAFTGIQNIGNYAAVLVWGGATTTIGTPEVKEEEPTEKTPEELGYTRKTLSKDFGIADGLYDAQGLTEKAASGSLNNTYLDVDVTFGLDSNGGVDPYAGLRYASSGGWAGIRISLGDGGTLRISDATSNAQDFTITATEAGVTNFTTKFNLKLAVKIAANGAAGLSDVTMNVWVNDKLVAKDKEFTGIQNIGNYAAVLVWGGATTTIGTPADKEEDEEAGLDGYTKVTFLDDFGIADGVYNTQGLTERVYGKSTLDKTYLDVDVSFGYDSNGGVDPYAGLRYASTGGWAGIRISLGDGGVLRISDATSNAQDFTITAEDADVTNFTTKFNLKLAVDIAASASAGLSDVTMNVWVNDKHVAKNKEFTGIQNIGNYAGVLVWGGASTTIGTPGTSTEDTNIPDISNPPTEMDGETWVGKYITSVDKQGDTTVISGADTDNDYATSTNYKNYNLDYVLDLNVDRELKILQLTDTQIIDAAQCRTTDRLGEGQKSAWATENMYNNVFRYIIKAVKDTKPDLILLTGDIIYGEFDDNGTSLVALINCMDSLKIPWAPVFGNHENESNAGVVWQCKQLENSPYCLFERRNDIGGNGNYSVGIAKNGQLERVIYMMDSNGCANSSSVNGSAVKTSVGFTAGQKTWYENAAKKVNQVAGKTIPSFLGYHIPTNEVLEAAEAAGYQNGDNAGIKYTIGVDNTAKPGDSGYKGEIFQGMYEETGLLEIMKRVGTDGAFFGHSHLNSTSVAYEGIRWTFGLKTGTYDSSPGILGGTLITLANDDSNDFTVEQTQTTALDIALEYPNKEYQIPDVELDKPLEPTEDTTPEDLGYRRKTLSDDFDITDGTYTGLNNQIKAALADLNNTYLDVDVTFGYKSDGSVDAEAGLRYANGTGWAGIKTRLETGDKLWIGDAALAQQYIVITPEEAGVETFTKEFNYKLGTEITKVSDTEHNVKVTVWINDKLIKQTTFTRLTYIGNNAGLLTWSDATITVGTPEGDYVPDLTDKEELPKGYKKISFNDFNIDNGTYASAMGMSVEGFYKDSLDKTLFDGDVIFNNVGGYLTYGGKASAWEGIRFEPQKDGTIRVYAARPWEVPLTTLDPDIAGIDLIGKRFNLKLTTLLIDMDGDGNKTDLQFGIWINNVLYKNKYVIATDYKDALGGYMGIYCPEKGSDMTVDAGEVDYGTPIKPDSSLKHISFSSFGVEDGKYGYNNNDQAVTGTYFDPIKGKVLDGTLIKGYISLDDGTDIRFGGKDNPWTGIYLIATGESLHLYAQDKLIYKFMPDVAGTKLVGKQFGMQISIVYVDSDDDGKKDDVQFGIWFNNKLYKNQYIYLKDLAPQLGSMMGIYSPYKGRYVKINSMEVDNEADLRIFGFGKGWKSYLNKSGKPMSVLTKLGTTQNSENTSSAPFSGDNTPFGWLWLMIIAIGIIAIIPIARRKIR